ncbi:MAG: hypothetical protein DRQ88_04645 [Epsilonproteobacteria bacterium]|nr:MAG: hypothetical protein DRQ89_06830 [Campylobacterota bacterium]RLA66929.1 MAG: hypothetical protein DRQ88_04645 [Campylobacterota bacterium]
MKTLILSLFLTFNLFAKATPVLTVGSKLETENKILAEIIAQALETTGEVQIERKFSLGSSGVIYNTLKKGDIDIYPEYSKRIGEVVISSQWQRHLYQINKALAGEGILMAGLLGFNNSYSLVVKKDNVKFKNIENISDLKGFTSYQRAFSYDFLRAQDGFSSVFKAYGIDTGIKHRSFKMKKDRLIGALNSGEVDLIQVGSTSPDIVRHNLKVIKDDKKHMSRNFGIILVKGSFAKRFPASWKLLNDVILKKITNDDMAKMNAQVELEGKTYSTVAMSFLKKAGLDTRFSLWKQISPKFFTHLQLVIIPLLFSTLFGLFLVVMATKNKVFEKLVSSINRFYKPIPFLIILCVLIPFLGTGKVPVYMALFIFGIFPIVKWSKSTNEEDANLSWWGTPMASHNIWAGIKNTAFINVGIATLAAYIGAGGLGDLIISGLSGKDKNLILMGVIPAIILAAFIHLIVELSDKYTTPKSLRR